MDQPVEDGVGGDPANVGASTDQLDNPKTCEKTIRSRCRKQTLEQQYSYASLK